MAIDYVTSAPYVGPIPANGEYYAAEKVTVGPALQWAGGRLAVR